MLLICTHNQFSRFEDFSCLEVGKNPRKVHIHSRPNAFWLGYHDITHKTAVA